MRFFRQTVREYRDFQIIFTILTLNFAIPTLSYVFVPEVSHAQFQDLNLMLGGVAYLVDEPASFFWRYLGAANVAALAFMCAFLQWDLRRNFRVVIPLTFLKATAATLWLAGYISHPEYPAFLAAAILDYASSFAFVFFATRAYLAIQDVPDDGLVPKPAGAGRLGMTGVETRWAHVLFRAILPDETLNTDQVLGRLDAMKNLPEAARIGIRASVVFLTWGPTVLGFGAPLHRLSPDQRDAFLTKASSSRWYGVRQLVEIPKTFVGLAHFGDPVTRASL